MKPSVKEAMFNLKDDLKEFPDTMMITVKRSDLQTVVNHLHHCGDEWSNQAALGYAIEAARSIGAVGEDVEELISAMRSEFDSKSLDEAAEIYRKSDY